VENPDSMTRPLPEQKRSLALSLGIDGIM